MSNSDTFQDFCQAWRSRFPHSELPAAWEEDVRANLAKHKAKVNILSDQDLKDLSDLVITRAESSLRSVVFQ